MDRDDGGLVKLVRGEVRSRARTREGRACEVHVCDADEPMALAHDSDGVLCLWGEAAVVEARAASLSEALRDALGDRAPSVTVVRFMPTPESVAELNACIATTGRVLRFAAALAGMEGVDEVPPPSMRH